MIDRIEQRLKALGYEVTEADYLLLRDAAHSAEMYIRHYCNVSTIPSCLDHVLIDIAAANFLLCKQSTGQLTGIQLEQVVKKIQDGDASVEYAGTVDREATFNTFLLSMQKGYNSELNAHRKMRW